MSKISSAKIKGKLPGIKWHCNIVIKVIILIKGALPYHQLEKECPLRKMSKEHEQTIYLKKKKNTWQINMKKLNLICSQ